MALPFFYFDLVEAAVFAALSPVLRAGKGRGKTVSKTSQKELAFSGGLAIISSRSHPGVQKICRVTGEREK